MNLVKENKSIIPRQIEEGFDVALTQNFSAEPEWSKIKRKKSFEAFLKVGIPNRKNELYKYTDVRKIFSDNIRIEQNGTHAVPDISSIIDNSIKIVFVNGNLQGPIQRVGLSKEIIIGNLANNKDAAKKYLTDNKDPFANLNTALWTDGAYIFIPASVQLKQTIEIVNIITESKNTLVNLRHLIVAEKNAEVAIVERYITSNTVNSIVNTVSDIVLSANSKLLYYRLQNNCRSSSLISSINVMQASNSFFDTNTVILNSEWVRNNLTIQLNGENCESHLNGLFITNATDHVDNHTAVLHNEPNCQSNQLYKGVLGGKSTGVFNGKIYVKRDAQKTNAYQSSKNILMSDDATINTKPELEIYADDVKCSHGSSTGKIDSSALFYLRSRGLSEESAKRLLLFAFAHDVLNTIRIDSFKKYLEDVIDQRFVSNE